MFEIILYFLFVRYGYILAGLIAGVSGVLLVIACGFEPPKRGHFVRAAFYTLIVAGLVLGVWFAHCYYILRFMARNFEVCARCLSPRAALGRLRCPSRSADKTRRTIRTCEVARIEGL